jgi:hypothetical protein
MDPRLRTYDIDPNVAATYFIGCCLLIFFREENIICSVYMEEMENRSNKILGLQMCN